YDMCDPLVRIVHDDRELIRHDAVAAPQDDVSAGVLQSLALEAGQVVAEFDGALHAHAQRRLTAERPALLTLAPGQIAAEARIQRSVRSVRSRGRAAHVGPRAEA